MICDYLLFLQLVLLDFFLLGLVDGFDQDLLVLELVTLGGKVEAVVSILFKIIGN